MGKEKKFENFLNHSTDFRCGRGVLGGADEALKTICGWSLLLFYV